MTKPRPKKNASTPPTNGDGHAPADTPEEVLASIAKHEASTEPFEPGEEFADAIGRTMFDSPGAQDGTVTGLLPPSCLNQVANQALVRIRSIDDGRVYLGAVSSGPFAEPDGLRADAPVLVTASVRGGLLMPRFHGRMQIVVIGEELADGKLVPPRRRPLPNSPIWLLDAAETAVVLNSIGDICLGVVDGLESVEVRIPSDKKLVVPRHLGVLGTTGAGKSTTVSNLIDKFQKAGWAVVLLDTEGEYTTIDKPADHASMLAALERRGIEPHGVEKTHLYHLVNRETSNPDHPRLKEFTLPFNELSPHAVAEILDLPPAQVERFITAFDVTKTVLDRVEIQDITLDFDELETGYPKMTLNHLIDVVRLLHDVVEKKELSADSLATKEFRDRFSAVKLALPTGDDRLPGNKISWRGLWGKLGLLERLKIFDIAGAPKINYAKMLQPGNVSIFDLSDMIESPMAKNLAIALLLRGIQVQQDKNYAAATKADEKPTRTLVLIEEAHEFLSAARIKQMPNLFSQVAKIARRGRKRWLALGFITQLPQHLPDEVLALINNFIFHKISDASVISRLKKSVGGIDESLWSRLSSLAPGQAVASFAHLTRALQVAVDPSPCKLHMVD